MLVVLPFAAVVSWGPRFTKTRWNSYSVSTRCHEAIKEALELGRRWAANSWGSISLTFVNMRAKTSSSARQLLQRLHLANATLCLHHASCKAGRATSRPWPAMPAGRRLGRIPDDRNTLQAFMQRRVWLRGAGDRIFAVSARHPLRRSCVIEIEVLLQGPWVSVRR